MKEAFTLAARFFRELADVLEGDNGKFYLQLTLCGHVPGEAEPPAKSLQVAHGK